MTAEVCRDQSSNIRNELSRTTKSTNVRRLIVRCVCVCVDRAFASPKFHGLLKCLQGAGIGQLPTATAHGKNTNALIHGVFVSMEGRC